MVTQLAEERKRQGMTIAELRRRARLRMADNTISQKLTGVIPTTTREAEMMAQALRYTITFAPIVRSPAAAATDQAEAA